MIDIDVNVETAGVPGLSAYEIYVKRGGTLTEEEWLESLKGQNGITPNITIGNTQTLDAGSNATVSKTGTTLNPIFSFGIPQGIQGIQGAKGDKGDKGEKGDKGDKGEKGDPGASALSISIVQTLPTQNISLTTIYLLKNEETTGNNLYDEYIYANNKWEKIGSTSVDLSNYYTKTQVDNLIPTIPTNVSSFNNDAGYLTSHQDLSNYVTKSQTSGLIKNDGTIDTNTYLTQHQDISGKLDTNKVKNTNSTTAGDVYDVRYINTMLGDIESLLGGI